jgi:hypothetical protein
MKIMILLVGMVAFNAMARIHCVEQAESIAQAAYDQSYRINSQSGEKKISKLDDLKWEFDFKEENNTGKKIIVKMERQEDPGTHCEIQSLETVNY